MNGEVVKQELAIHPSISAADLSADYPFHSHYLNLDGNRLHFVDEGSGPVLLFVHGNPTWSFAWRHLIKNFRENYRCLAIDHLGCGLSDKPQNYPYRLASHIANLRQLVESLDLQEITLIAHDWGGAIGSGVAGQLPDRFSKLVLMNTAAFRSQLIPWRIAACRIPFLGTWGVQGLNLFSRAALKMAVEAAYPLRPEIQRGYLLPYDSWNHRVAVNAFVKDIPLKNTHPSYAAIQQVEENLQLLATKPVLLPWGMRDWCFTPAFLRRFQEFFPAAQVQEFGQAGHYLFEEVPHELSKTIRNFLQTNV